MVDQAIPDVSVIIPAYNALPYLHRGLESLVAQTLGTDRMEIVVVDDGSTDGTGEAIDEWAARHPGLFRVVHSTPSGGPAAPRNIGLGMVRGRYVYFLDADDYLGTEALERLLTTADEEGSDIVLGKMAATSERGVPQSMYRRNDLDADLYTSRVWWTLAALKLFRRTLIEDNNLRFPTEYPKASDQPFTALAYLRARKISVLSDYDFYYVVLRDDGKHVTRSGKPSNDLDVTEVMCELIEEEVLDVDKRAPLLARHFQIDLDVVMKGMLEVPRAEQEALLARVVRLVHRHLSSGVCDRLSPDKRVVYYLASQGLLEETLHAVRESADTSYEVFIEDERALAVLPYFRDPSVQVPEALYDVTDRLRPEFRLDSFECLEGGRFTITGTAGFLRVRHPIDVSLVFRSDDDPTVEHVVPGTQGEGNAFRVDADMLTVAAGEPLGEGTWRVEVVISKDGVSRDWRVKVRDSEDRTEEVSTSFAWAATEDGDGWTAAAYLTKAGRLRLDVNRRKGASGKQFSDWRVSWDDTDLVVRGEAAAPRVNAPTRFFLRGPDDEVRRFPAEHEGSRVTGRVPMRELSEGRWQLRFRVGKAPAHRPVTVDAERGLDPLTWREGLKEFHVVQVEGQSLSFDVTSETLAGRASRKLRSITGR